MSSNLGDLVSNLVLDSSRYTSGAYDAIRTNKTLSGSRVTMAFEFHGET